MAEKSTALLNHLSTGEASACMDAENSGTRLDLFGSSLLNAAARGTALAAVPDASAASADLAPIRIRSLAALPSGGGGSGGVLARRASCPAMPARAVSGASMPTSLGGSWHGGDAEHLERRISANLLDMREVQSLHMNFGSDMNFRPEQPWRIPAVPPTQLHWGRDPEKRNSFLFMFEALAILSNVLAGPGILQFPQMVTRSGWLMTLVSILLFSFLTAKISCLLAKALKQMSLRERLTKSAVKQCARYELSDLVRETHGERAFLCFQVVLNLGLLLLCLATVVAAGTTMDRLLTVTTGNSYAIQLSGSDAWGGPWMSRACEGEILSDNCINNHFFEETKVGISAGYVLVALICLPLTCTNFANLMWFQYIALGICLGSVLTFVATCFVPNDSAQFNWHAPSALGSDPGFAISTCFLSFALAFAVPTWWNDNEPDCPAEKAINVSVGYTMLVYYLPMAFLPACAFLIPSDEDTLDLYLNGDIVNIVAVVAAYLLAILGIAPNVIAYAVAMRDNLQSIGPLFTFRVSLAIGCLGPFLVGWALDKPTGFGVAFDLVVNWAGVFLMGAINFIVPLLIIIRLAGSQLNSVSCVGSQIADDPSIEPWTSSELTQAKMMLVASVAIVSGGFALNLIAAL